MNLTKLIIVLCAAGFAYHHWGKQYLGSEQAAGAASAPSRNGFVALPAVAGASTKAVLIIAAENCPEEAAQRADRLAEDLARGGVPVSRLHSVSFDIPNGDSSVADRVMSVMNGELPIVFVHGKAKSNPRLEEVFSEYRAPTAGS